MTTDTDEQVQDLSKLPRNWRLIQRYLKQLPNSTQLGVAKFLRGDYMGASEFEDGRVQKSWKAMRELGKRSNLQCTHMSIQPTGDKKTLSIWIICHKDAPIEALRQSMHLLAGDPRTMRLTEPTYFNDHFSRRDPIPEYRKGINSWLVLDDVCPVFWSLEKGVADAMYEELKITKGVRPEDLSLFDKVKFEHAGQIHTGEVVGIYDHHAIVNCADPNLTGRQKVPYSEIWKP